MQEVGFALATAVAVLDAVRDGGQVPPERMGDVVARISFFVNAGVRFVEEMAKMRAFAALWDEITRDALRRRPTPDARRFRYGVQVNSLGLTEAQPENNVAAHRAGDARRDAVPRRPGPGRAAARLERGARPAPAVGPAVVAADAAGAGVRVGPAGVPRPVRGLARGRRRWSTRIVDGARAELERGAGAGRRRGGGGVGLPQGRAGRLAGRAPPRGSSRARTWWSASTGSPRPSRRR